MSKAQTIDHDEPRTVGDLIDGLPAPHPRTQALATTPAHSSAVTPMQMLQIAVERGADLDMLEKLMALQERWEAGEARKAYVVAMTNFKADAPSLTKNKHVAFGNTKYDHATLDEVCDVVGPALARHGLSHGWKTEQAEHDVIRVSCIITHALGHSESVTLSAKPDTSGQKNAIQAIGSAISYLQRYTLLAATGLAAKEQDDDGRRTDKGALISVEQKETLIGLQQEVGAETKAFLKYLGVATLDDLPASRFKDAVAALDKKRGAKA